MSDRKQRRRKFTFIPNKESRIYGAFLDLGRPIKCLNNYDIACKIASTWGEEI